MLRGQRPFRRETMAETMTAILKDDPPDVTVLNGKVSPQLERIVRRCLEKKPEHRFQSAHDLGFALEGLSSPSGMRLDSTGASARKAETLRRRFVDGVGPGLGAG